MSYVKIMENLSLGFRGSIILTTQKNMHGFCFLALFAGLICSVYSHSWLACSDYAEKDAADWDPRKCRGFPRDSARYAPKNRFGIDTGGWNSGRGFFCF